MGADGQSQAGLVVPACGCCVLVWLRCALGCVECASAATRVLSLGCRVAFNAMAGGLLVAAALATGVLGASGGVLSLKLGSVAVQSDVFGRLSTIYTVASFGG